MDNPAAVAMAIGLAIALVVLGTLALRRVVTDQWLRLAVGSAILLLACALLLPLVVADGGVMQHPFRFAGCIALWGVGLNQLADALRARLRKAA